MAPGLRDEGLVDEEVWQNFLKNDGGDWFKMPQIQVLLNGCKGALSERFREEIRNEIAA